MDAVNKRLADLHHLYQVPSAVHTAQWAQLVAAVQAVQSSTAESVLTGLVNACCGGDDVRRETGDDVQGKANTEQGMVWVEHEGMVFVVQHATHDFTHTP